jgi:hypothetical protein
VEFPSRVSREIRKPIQYLQAMQSVADCMLPVHSSSRFIPFQCNSLKAHPFHEAPYVFSCAC